MIKDSIGNRLSEGHFVEVRLPAGTNALRGRIKSMKDGSRGSAALALQQNAAIQPGLVTIEILLPVEVDPITNQMPQVIRVWDPTGKDLAAAKTGVEQ